MTLMPHLISPWLAFFFILNKKILKGKCFADVEEVKQTPGEALKGIKIDKVRNCFEEWKKVLIGVLHQIENTLKVTEV